MKTLRKKIYYLSNEIENGLYTEGKEFMTMENEEYKGYYNKCSSTGEVYTESNFDENKSVPLQRFVPHMQHPLVKQYQNIKMDENKIEYESGYVSYIKRDDYDPTKYVAPISYYPKPTEEDYANGFFERYFLRKRNEPNLSILEINSPTFNNVRMEGPIDGHLYDKLSIKWKLTGVERDIYENGILVEHGIYDTNRRMVVQKDVNFKGLKKYLTDYLEFGKLKKI